MSALAFPFMDRSVTMPPGLKLPELLGEEGVGMEEEEEEEEEAEGTTLPGASLLRASRRDIVGGK